MPTTLRAALTATRARRTARHLAGVRFRARRAGVRFRARRAQVSDSATRAAEHRRHVRPTALTHAR
ncbi:hypothetical protein GCM10010451_11480 [Streptomyces virens]|uniref:Uncharacterized protein n=1 Tax=Streptomyces virens TaxID=285572 RepID=A0ABP6P1U3_9ACTN|nr:hypothetical protein [Streptomyces calvus]MBA8973982.1 hypothetical protein [Streptomyces calvus]